MMKLRRIGISSAALISGIIMMTAACSDARLDAEKEDRDNHLPIPLTTDTVYQASGYKVEVVDFKGLQPLLSQDDETIQVINFWATWCVPCVAELPYFQRLAADYEDVNLTLVSLDFSTKVESDLLPFIQKNKIENRVVLLNEPDANSWIPKIDPDWSGAIPATIIYRGKKREFYEQSFTFETLEKEVKKFYK